MERTRRYLRANVETGAKWIEVDGMGEAKD